MNTDHESNIAESARQYVLDYLQNQASKKGVILGEVDENQNLLDLGVLDSLGFVQMLMAMESALNVEIDFGEMDAAEFTTLTGLVAVSAKSAVPR